MRTRRQTRLQSEVEISVSPPTKKNKLIRGKKDESESKNVKKPSKRVKKQKQRSPSSSSSPSPEPVRNTRGGRKKKQQRITQKHDSKRDSNEDKKLAKDHQNAKQRKSEAKRKKEQEPQKDKIDKPEHKKPQKQKAKKQSRSRSRSPSPSKKHKKSQSPQKQQIKKVIVKGAAPVDQYFNKGKDYHVLVHDGKVYSATLNQTNISNNNNKYYNLQVIQSDKDPNVNYFMTRWGRVGTQGQKSIVGPLSINVAISEYLSKFRQKHQKGQYRQLQLNYGSDEQQQQQPSQNPSNQPLSQNPLQPYQQSQLPKPLKDLITLIFDLGMMNKQMKQIGYNVNKMPLGKLSKDNIKRGYQILKKLEEEIQRKKRGDVMEELTNQFYSYIPHDVGFRNMSLYKLDTIQKVKQKIQMLQSLAQIKIATQILNQTDQSTNQLDNNYKKLNRKITPIQKDSFTYKLLNDYLQSTHASTHTSYNLELIQLFEVDSEMERNRFMGQLHNRMLLWHGSRLTNFVGILSQGLRIAPPQAPVTGYMFGKGVYFADMSSKSANYCFTTPENNTGLLILCQVALGNWNQKMHADPLASNLPQGKHSTKGMGRTVPNPSNFQSLDGMIIPMGPGEPANLPGCSLLYNEYIVYKVEQVKIKYLLRVKFHYKRHGF